jgi:hypothetical protein
MENFATTPLRARSASRAQVEQIVNGALVRSRGREALPNVAELIQQLEEARHLAMATSQPKAAIDATMAMGRLLGLVIDRSAVAVGSPDDFRKTQEQIIQDMREAIGDGPTQQFLEAMENMRRTYNGRRGDDDVIEGEARHLGNGSVGGDNV